MAPSAFDTADVSVGMEDGGAIEIEKNTDYAFLRDKAIINIFSQQRAVMSPYDLVNHLPPRSKQNPEVIAAVAEWLNSKAEDVFITDKELAFIFAHGYVDCLWCVDPRIVVEDEIVQAFIPNVTNDDLKNSRTLRNALRYITEEQAITLVSRGIDMAHLPTIHAENERVIRAFLRTDTKRSAVYDEFVLQPENMTEADARKLLEDFLAENKHEHVIYEEAYGQPIPPMLLPFFKSPEFAKVALEVYPFTISRFPVEHMTEDIARKFLTLAEANPFFVQALDESKRQMNEQWRTDDSDYGDAIISPIKNFYDVRAFMNVLRYEFPDLVKYLPNDMIAPAHIEKMLTEDGRNIAILDEKYRNNRWLVRLALEHLSPSLESGRGNNSFVNAIGDRFKNEISILKKVLTKDGAEYKNIPEHLKDNFSLMNIAAKSNDYLLYYCTRKFLQDKKGLTALINENPNLIKGASFQLRMDLFLGIVNPVERPKFSGADVSILPHLLAESGGIHTGKYAGKLYNLLNIPKTTFVKDVYKKLGNIVFSMQNGALLNPAVTLLIGEKNVYSIIKYLEVPKKTLKLNELYETGKLEAALRIFEKLKEINGMPKDSFNLSLFQKVINGCADYQQLIGELMESDVFKYDFFMLKKLFNSEKTYEVNSVHDLRMLPYLAHIKNSKLINSDDIFEIKRSIYSILCCTPPEKISEILLRIASIKKLKDLGGKLGAEYADKIKYFTLFTDILSKIEECRDKELLKELAIKLNKQLLSNAALTDNWLDEINGQFCDFKKELKKLYGAELKKSMIDIHTLHNTIDSKSGLKVIELNGQDFSMIVHTLNGCGSGAKISDFTTRERGSAYLCACLVNNNFLGHVSEYGETEGSIRLGFVNFTPDMYVMSGPTDLRSSASGAYGLNNRNVTATTYECMTSDETAKRTLHYHNEYVLYREAESGERIMPNCVLCFNGTITNAQRKAAKAFDPALPIVKIDARKYKMKHRQKITELEKIIAEGEITPALTEDYLLLLTSYCSGYAWMHNNRPDGDAFLKRSDIPRRAEQLYKAVKARGSEESMRTFENTIDYISQSRLDKKTMAKQSIERVGLTARLAEDSPTTSESAELTSLRGIREFLAARKAEEAVSMYSKIFQRDYGREFTDPYNSLSIKMQNYGDICKQKNMGDVICGIKEFEGKTGFEWFNEELSENIDDKFYLKGIHGKTHADNVTVFSYYIAKNEGLSDDDVRIIVEAAKYHDIGRVHNDANEDHGAVGAKKYREMVSSGFSDGEVREIMFIIEAHSLDPASKIEELLNAQLEGISPERKERLMEMAHILRDGDALDRTRFRLKKTTNDLAPELLVTKTAGSMILAAQELNFTKSVLSNADLIMSR
ncbi:MAG: hypothetical protein LBL34_02030 [Clostridiales bacterium]|jgi:hypothetical protein|nr:hypothetical protein [Clostridiales bacterium]